MFSCRCARAPLLHILLGLAIAGALLAPQACDDKLGNSAWWTHRKLLAVLVALFLLEVIPFSVRLYANTLPDSNAAGERRLDTSEARPHAGRLCLYSPCPLWSGKLWLSGCGCCLSGYYFWGQMDRRAAGSAQMHVPLVMVLMDWLACSA